MPVPVLVPIPMDVLVRVVVLMGISVMERAMCMKVGMRYEAHLPGDRSSRTA